MCNHFDRDCTPTRRVRAATMTRQCVPNRLLRYRLTSPGCFLHLGHGHDHVFTDPFNTFTSVSGRTFISSASHRATTCTFRTGVPILRLLYCLDVWHLALEHHWHIHGHDDVPDLWDIHGCLRFLNNGIEGVLNLDPCLKMLVPEQERCSFGKRTTDQRERRRDPLET